MEENLAERKIKSKHASATEVWKIYFVSPFSGDRHWRRQRRSDEINRIMLCFF